MPKKLRPYVVTEVVEYVVMAEDAEHAETIITEASNRDKFATAVVEREAEPMPDDYPFKPATFRTVTWQGLTVRVEP